MGTEDWGIIALGGLASLIASIFYMWGGTKGFGKYWRRYIGAFVLALACNLIAVYTSMWVWQMLLVFPALLGGFSLPYGADDLVGKIVKRAVFASGVCFAGFFCLWGLGFPGAGIGIFVMQLVVGLGSVFLGVKNPYKNAPLEQYMICQLLTFTIPFWGFI